MSEGNQGTDLPKEVKEAVEGVSKGLKHIEEKQAQAAKDNDSLIKEEVKRVSEDLGQKFGELEAEHSKRLAAMQQPKATSADQKEELKRKCSELFVEFTKKGGNNDFADFVASKGLGADEIKAMSVNSNDNGGFLVLPQFGGIIENRSFETSPVRLYANVVPITTDALELGLDGDEAAGGWVGETGDRDATNTPTVGKRNIPTHELYAAPELTQKMIDDGIVNVEEWIANKVADKLTRLEATAFISGNGVAQPTGILHNTTGSDAFSANDVQEVNSGTQGSVTYAGLVNTQNALKEVYQNGARWLMKRSTYGAVMQIVDGESRPIFNMAYDKNTGIPVPTILNAPVSFADDVPAVANDVNAIIYGNLRGYTIADRVGIRVLRDPFTNKPFVQFYTTKRVGGAVTIAEAIKVNKLSS
jgi:HK97 family phage major capsid protein